MKSLFLSLSFLFVVVIMAFQKGPAGKIQHAGKQVKWYTWQQAMELNKTKPRKVLVDVYTDWCGWCKRMDAEAFVNDTITEYLDKNFYCVKLNAEMQGTLEFQGHTFNWVSPQNGGGRNGFHELAYALLEGNMVYPNLVYLNEKYERIMISPGYKEANKLLPELRFAAEEAYKTKTWAEFLKENQ